MLRARSDGGGRASRERNTGAHDVTESLERFPAGRLRLAVDRASRRGRHVAGWARAGEAPPLRVALRGQTR